MAGLREKLEASQERQNEVCVDPDLVVKQWQALVNALYSEIADCLSYLKDRNLGTFDRIQTQKHEEPLGDYQIDTLVVETPKLRVMFDPRGTYVIGGQGRVDIVQIGQARHSAMLLYLTGGQKAAGHWEIREPHDIRTGIGFECRTLDELLGKWIDAR